MKTPKMKKHVLVGCRGAGRDAEVACYHHTAGCIAIHAGHAKACHYLIHSEAEFRLIFRRKPGVRQLERLAADDTVRFHRLSTTRY